MKYLVIGGDGLVGSALVNYLQGAGHLVYKTSRRSVNSHVTDLHLNLIDLSRFKIPDVDVMFLVAAVTKVVDCEADPSIWQINADAPVELARRAKNRSVHTVFISSDAVERAPNMIYSKQKAYVESFVLATEGTVVRPSRIPPDQVGSLVELLVKLGSKYIGGLHRWSPTT